MYHAFQTAKEFATIRVLPCLLALMMLLSAVPMTAFSVDLGAETAGTETSSLPEQTELVYDYDTLKIMRDGQETYALSLHEHEKIEIQAVGVSEQADYQWQIQHPENDDLWVDIYDETDPTLALTAALIGGVLREDGTAKVRCRAYTDDCAYLTSPFTVTLTQDAPVIYSSTPMQFQDAPVFMAEGDSEFVMVKIEYVQYDFLREADGSFVVDEDGVLVLDDGKQAFTPYIATIKSGTELITTVPNPTMVGYDAYFGDEISTSVSINETVVNSDITYTVEYKPALVDYTVRYYFQNIYDDLYVEDTSCKVTDKGYTGSAPPDDILKKEVEGFTSLYYQPDAIAADGSTVFEVYYERNYYLMEFDCNGGYGAETIYVRYGSYISVPQPVKSGYVFLGWDLVKTEQTGYTGDLGDGNVDPLPANMPPYNTGYKALWKTADTTYTVVYWIQNDDGTKTYVANKPVESISGKTVSGSDDLTADTNVCGLQEHTHTTCGFSCGKAEHSHSDGNCNYACGEHTHGVDQCDYTCGKTQHTTHTRECYTFTNINVQTSTSNNVGNLYKTIDGFEIYRRRQGNSYNYYIKIEDSYYRITNFNNSIDTIQYTVDELHTHTDECCSLHTHSEACCDLPEHAHDADCYDCGLTAHTHSDACKVPNASYMEFIEADQEVVVEGDGSTVVNVYYKYRTYTIRFIYARQNGTGYRIANSTGNGTFAQCSWVDMSGDLPTFRDPSGKTERSSVVIDGYTYYYISLSAQFGADISALWPSANLGKAGSYSFGSWAAAYGTGYRKKYGDEHANIVGPYPTMSEDMILPNAEKLADGTYLAQNMIAWWGGTDDYVSAHAYHNYFEVLSDERIEGEIYKEYNGKTYILKTEVFTAAHNGTTRVDPVIYAGYEIQNEDKDTQANSSNYQNNSNCPKDGDAHDYCCVFYYNRSEYTLAFVNYNSSSEAPESQKMQFEEPLSGKNPGDPSYPSGIEPGAYEFGGWYTTPECFDGTEVNWETMTMPDSDLTLYAKWTPVLRDVTFYTDYSDMAEGATPFLEAKDVPHGSLLDSTYQEIPKKENYVFVGWFYMDEDNKKRFAPDSMEITRDLKLFAEWQTSIDTTYEIKYALKEAVSAENVPSKTDYPAGTLIADTLFAHSSVGRTKTFSAKGLGELYPDFQKKFFPTVNTHSILMEPKGEDNTYTFEYIYDDTVYYKVRYVDYSTRTELRTAVVKSTDSAIVTEKFLPISGYIPQNFYIRKSLAADGGADADSVIAENVITFYYTQDTTHGLYSVEYYLENEDSTDFSKVENYFQYESIVGSADIDTEFEATVRTYDGYTHVPELNTVITYNSDGTEKESLVGVDKAGNPPKGTVDYTGLTIKIYYKRNSYPYIIEYREYGAEETAKPLKVIADGSELYLAKFDTKVSHTADSSLTLTSDSETIVYEYYQPDADEKARTKTMTIRKTESGETNPNKLVFYYTKKKVTVIYEAVCKVPGLDNFGAVSIYSESAATAAGLSGSNAMVGTGFRFEGWYADEACTTAVDASWVTNGTKLVPGTLDTTKDEIHYYALFEPIYGKMQITKQVMDNNAKVDPSDHFMFRIVGNSINCKYIDLIVTVEGSNSVTIDKLPIGNYTVTEITSWSWDYTAVDAEVTDVLVKDSLTTTVDFTNNANNSNWLSDETANENVFEEST